MHVTRVIRLARQPLPASVRSATLAPAVRQSVTLTTRPATVRIWLPSSLSTLDSWWPSDVMRISSTERTPRQRVRAPELLQAPARRRTADEPRGSPDNAPHRWYYVRPKSRGLWEVQEAGWIKYFTSPRQTEAQREYFRTEQPIVTQFKSAIVLFSSLVSVHSIDLRVRSTRGALEWYQFGCWCWRGISSVFTLPLIDHLAKFCRFRWKKMC